MNLPSRLLLSWIVLSGLLGLYPDCLYGQLVLETPDISICSVAGAPVSHNLAADITGSYATLAIAGPTIYGTATLDSAGTLLYTPSGSGMATTEQFNYVVCTFSGVCSSGVITVILADVANVSVTPTYLSYTIASPTTATNICNGNIGWEYQHNGEPNLYMVTVTNNTNIGYLSYVDDGCVLYTPIAAGFDTIKVVGCGDAPPPMLFTCNGYLEQMNTCSHTYYVVHVLPDLSTAFTENHTINCNSDITINGLGYPTWVMPSIVSMPSNGTATIVPDGLVGGLHYTPNPGFSGTDTVIVACAEATQITCTTGIYVFEVNCTTNDYDFSEEHDALCHETTYIPLGCGNTPIITQQPENGIAAILYGDACNMLVYMPFNNFVGLDNIGVTCATTDSLAQCQDGLYIVDVVCEFGGNNNVIIISDVECDVPFTSTYLAGGFGTSPIILSLPQHGTATITDGHYLTYNANDFFVGNDTVWVDCVSSGPADGCQSALYIFQVDCQNGTATPDALENVHIQNDPIAHQLHIQLKNGVTLQGNITLFNLQGRVVQQYISTQNEAMTLATDKLPSGMYLITIPTSKGVATQKLWLP